MDAYSLDNAKLECEGNPNCHMFIDSKGRGVLFGVCVPTASPAPTLKGDILYIKDTGAINNRLNQIINNT